MSSKRYIGKAQRKKKVRFWIKVMKLLRREGKGRVLEFDPSWCRLAVSSYYEKQGYRIVEWEEEIANPFKTYPEVVERERKRVAREK